MATSLLMAAGASGASWSIQGTPAAGSPERLTSVSCTTERACMAVGAYTRSGRTLGLTETWNGTEWTQHAAVAAEEFTEREEFSDVSCTSESACTAVGSTRSMFFGHGPIVERWDGRAWTAQTPATPERATEFNVYGVACVSATACTAVGSANIEGRGSIAIVETWDGTSWSVQSPPRVSGTLYEISCSAANACTAVGLSFEAGGRQLSLAMRWNGSSWATQATPNGAARFTPFLDVSCGSASSCVAIGLSYDETHVGSAFSATWNGSAWTAREVPKPVGTEYSFLSGVSCTAAAACMAVGAYRTTPEAAELTLVEQWNGERWTIVTSPNPAGTRLAVLHAASCTSSVLCTATGFSSNRTTEGLAERYS